MIDNVAKACDIRFTADLDHIDGLLAPENLEQPAQKEKLDALISRVRDHPAMYSYFITDEPNATNFAGLGKLVGYLRERDPARLGE